MTEYECAQLGCPFVGTVEESEEHQVNMPGHDEFWSIPSWEELGLPDPEEDPDGVQA